MLASALMLVSSKNQVSSGRCTDVKRMLCRDSSSYAGICQCGTGHELETEKKANPGSDTEQTSNTAKKKRNGDSACRARLANQIRDCAYSQYFLFLICKGMLPDLLQSRGRQTSSKDTKCRFQERSVRDTHWQVKCPEELLKISHTQGSCSTNTAVRYAKTRRATRINVSGLLGALAEIA